MGNEHDQWKKHEHGLRDDLFRKVEWLTHLSPEQRYRMENRGVYG